MSCFEIKNLSFSYSGAPGGASEGDREHSGAPGYFDTPKALQDIDLTVEDGEYVLLCGKSGCGKTTPLRIDYRRIFDIEWCCRSYRNGNDRNAKSVK